MIQRSYLNSGILFFVLSLAVFMFSVSCQEDKVAPDAASQEASKDSGSIRLEFVGEASFPAGHMFQGTEVGGLSGITYDPNEECYYAISDDRGGINSPRFYRLTIDLKDGRLDSEDATLTGVTFLKSETGEPFPGGYIDPEGIAVTVDDAIYISSEGDAARGIAPFINCFDVTGRQIRQLAIPAKYLPKGDTGVQNNLGFESLTITPDGRYLYTATEDALSQDQSVAAWEGGSLSRIMKYDLKSGNVVEELVYPVVEIPEDSKWGGGVPSNGLVELLAMDDEGMLISLERAYSSDNGFIVKLNEVHLRDARNVIGEYSLIPTKGSEGLSRDSMVKVVQILDFAQVATEVDNFEGMTFGSRLPDGRRTLIIVSDNNFKPSKATWFLAFAIEMRHS